MPAMLATTACCLPAKVLNKKLLPTLGRPIRATLVLVVVGWILTSGMSDSRWLDNLAMPEL